MRRLWKKYLKPYVVAGFLLVISGTLLVQCAGVLKIPGLDEILQREPAVTTSISDAVTGVPFLDDFDPLGSIPMITLPRTPDGSFLLEYPGSFVFVAQSYCLAAGKYSPSGEYGYLYAPLKGPRSTVIKNILKRSVNYPEIPQQDIQALLWAITSYTKISDMSEDMQQTAKKLLSKEEIFELNGGALGLIPEELLEKAFAQLPPQAQQVLEAEARLRGILTEGGATYDELEQVAVRFGTPPPQEGDLKIPGGRWSLHPYGYYIRYFPDGYTQMLIELYLPELFQIERDQRGRITLIADSDRNRIETDYDDTIEPLSIAGEPSLKAYAFRSICFEGRDPNDPGERLRTEWTDVGWTFLGVPTGEGHVNTSSDRFSGLRERYEWAKTHKKELNNLEDGVKKLLGEAAPPGISPHGMEEITSLGHYAIALKEAIGSSDTERKDWGLGHVNLVKRAWQSAFSRHMGTYKEKPVFDPAGDPVSGSKGEQPAWPGGLTPDPIVCRDRDGFHDCYRLCSQDFDPTGRESRSHHNMRCWNNCSDIYCK
jgi:hypothetical protein